jgi:hypothetical protein
MKIVPIFASNTLFSFHYENEEENELERNLNLWNDTEYVYQFLTENKQDVNTGTIEDLTEQIHEDANTIEEILFKLSATKGEKLDSFFKPLHNSEYQFKLLSLQKGRKNYLRIYALKIDENCFVITGGAIKLTHLMEERESTLKELQKLEKAKQFLKSNDVFDLDSFYEFLIETI